LYLDKVNRQKSRWRVRIYAGEKRLFGLIKNKHHVYTQKNKLPCNNVVVCSPTSLLHAKPINLLKG